MAVVAISDSNNRLDPAEATTNWSKIGNSLAQEPDFKYQGTYSISSKVGTTAGGHYLTVSAVNMTTGDNQVCLFKGLWTNKDVLAVTPSAVHRIGSGTSAYHEYYIADEGTQGDIDYPVKGGWIISPINPQVSAWRDSTTGSPSLTGVVYFATLGDFTASSKSENVCTDAVDLGDGLFLVGGTSTDPDGTIDDFIADDQGDLTNGRFGHVSTNEEEVVVYGRLVIGRTSAGTVTATVYTDSLRTIVFPGGRVDAGWNAFEIDCGNSSTLVTWNNYSIVGGGRNNLKRWFDSANEVDGTNEELDITAHGYQTGDAVLYSAEGGTAISDLTNNTQYFVRRVTADTLSLYTNRQQAYTGGATGRRNLTAAGTSATHSLRRQPDTRPDLDVVGTPGTFDANGCVFLNLREITLTAAADLSGAVLVGCTKLTPAGALLSSSTVNDHLTAEGEAFIVTADLSDIDDVAFDNTDGEGHAAEITSAAGSPYAMSGVTYAGYGPPHQEFHTTNDIDDGNDEVDIASHGFPTGHPVYYSDEGGTQNIGLTDQTRYYVRAVTAGSLSFHRTKYDAVNNSGKIALTAGGTETHAIYSANAAIYNSSGSSLQINVTDGSSPSVRNSAGSSTTVSQTVTYTVTQLTAGSEVGIYRTSDDTQLAFVESSGTSFAYPYNYVEDTPVYVIVQHVTKKWRYYTDTLTNQNRSVAANQQPDPDYVNP